LLSKKKEKVAPHYSLYLKTAKGNFVGVEAEAAKGRNISPVGWWILLRSGDQLQKGKKKTRNWDKNIGARNVLE